VIPSQPFAAYDVETEHTTRHSALALRPGPGGVVVVWPCLTLAIHTRDRREGGPDLTKILVLSMN